MNIHEAIELIISSIETDEQVIELCKYYFPFERFDIDGKYSEDILDDMLSLLIEEVGNDSREAEKMYYFLTDEKITIEDDEFYSEEEIDHG